MLFSVDPKSAIPIFQQIVAQVKFGVASGALRPGDFIPSVRDLASRIEVHPNTVAKAYQLLEQQNVVAARRGKGMEVTADAPEHCRMARQEIVRSRLRDALREAVSSALSAAEIRRLVDEELALANGQVNQDESPASSMSRVGGNT